MHHYIIKVWLMWYGRFKARYHSQPRRIPQTDKKKQKTAASLHVFEAPAISSQLMFI